MIEESKYTWEPITIKPNDQSLVGEVVKGECWLDGSWILVDYVGKNIIVGSDAEKDETHTYFVNRSFYIRREAQKKERMLWAHGWYKHKGGWEMTDRMYSSIEFRKYFTVFERMIWPAKMNPDGTFEEPDDEE